MPPAHEDGQSGSALVEALVAFTILTMSIVMALQGFSQGAGQVARSEAMALRLADGRSLLAQVSAAPSLAIGESRGKTANGSNWTMTVSQRPGAPEPAWTAQRAFDVGLDLTGSQGAAVHLETIVITRPSP